MLKVLRGDAVDWKEIEERHTPQRLCVGCNTRCFKDEFRLSQWNRKDNMQRCNACIDQQCEAGTPFECMNCFHWKSVNALDEKNLHRRVHRVCVDCIETRACLECGVPKAQEDFTPGEWGHAAKHYTGRQRGRCKACMIRNKPQAALRRCVGECQQMKPEADFTPREWQEAAKHLTSRQQGRCKACMTRNKPQAVLRKCVGECQQMKPEADFTPQEWQEAAKHRTGRQRGTCKACMARYKPQKVCSVCKEAKDETDYKSKKEFMNSGEDRRCKTCSGKALAVLRKCRGECQQMKPEADFTPWEWQEAAKHLTGRHRGRCKACMARHKPQKVCSVCNEAKGESEYKSTKEFMKSNEDRRCKTCSGTRRGCWTCINCRQSQPHAAFSKWLEKRTQKRNDGHTRCNPCTSEAEEEERRVREGSHAQVQGMQKA